MFLLQIAALFALGIAVIGAYCGAMAAGSWVSKKTRSRWLGIIVGCGLAITIAASPFFFGAKLKRSKCEERGPIFHECLSEAYGDSWDPF